MNKFDNIIGVKLTESVVTLSKDELDPSVFTFKVDGLPILRDSIKIQILKDVDEIRSVLPVVNFFLIGSILTKNYTDTCDMDITVQVDEQLVDSISTAEIMHLLHNLNGRLAADTRHPLNYYIITHEYNESKAEAIYDIVNEKWTKVPKNYDPDVEKWNTKFQSTLQSIDIATGALHRDLIDLEEIRNLNTKNIKTLKFMMKQKLAQIDELMKQLVTTYKDVKAMRGMSFDRFMTPQEVQMYGSQNRLPENILYKLLEKYYYTKFIKRIESILDERDELDLTDAPRVRKAMGDLWRTS
jgi:predicted nucleotidyltransferase